jgi:hypothetical protein
MAPRSLSCTQMPCWQVSWQHALVTTSRCLIATPMPPRPCHPTKHTERSQHLLCCLPACLPAEAQVGGFWSYVAGTAYRLLVQHNIGGLEILNYRTTLPMSKGLSSSAAACVMVRRMQGLRHGMISLQAISHCCGRPHISGAASRAHDTHVLSPSCM